MNPLLKLNCVFEPTGPTHGKPTLRRLLCADRRTSLLSTAALIPLLFTGQSAFAADISWVGNSGNFNSTAATEGWNNATKPVATDNALLNTGATVTIDTDQAVIDLRAGTLAAGSGIFSQTGGTVNATGWVRLGTVATSSGTYNLSGGTLNANTAGTGISVGTSGGGAGQFNVSNGGKVSTVNLHIGGDSSVGTGTLGISGDASSLNATGEVWVGQNSGSTGTLNISAGTVSTHNWVAVGRSASTGTVNLTGGTLTHDTANNSGGRFSIGSGGGGAGNGTMNQTGGTFTDSSVLILSEVGTATYNISGGTVNANGGVNMAQGASAATLNLQGASGLTGALANGGGGEIFTTTTLAMGPGTAAGNSTVNLGGGTLAINAITAGNGAGTKTFNFDGGLLRARIATTTFLGSTAVKTNVLAGGARIDSQANALQIDNALLHGSDAVPDGGLTKSGTGSLRLTGANTYNGATTISGGILDFATTASLPGYTTATGGGSNVTIASGGILVVGIGAANEFSIADFNAIRNNTSGKFSFAAGSGTGIDTTNATIANGFANNTLAYAGIIADTASGSNGFAKIGANTLSLTGTQTYTGATTITGGTLQVGDGVTDGTLATSGVTGSGGSISYNVLANRTLGYFITGSNSISKSGAGTDLKLAAAANTSSNLFVKQGSVTLGNGVSLVTNNYSSIGVTDVDIGTLNLTGNALLNNASDFNVSDTGTSTGTLNVSDTASLRVVTLYVGKGTGTNGTVNQSGGTVAQGNAGGDWRIGSGTGSTGNYNLSAGVLDSGNSNFQVGASGTGTFTQTGGVVNSNAYTDAGRYAGGVGIITVTGGVFNQTAGTGTLLSTAATPAVLAGVTASKLLIGENGIGTLNIGGTGVVNSLGGVVVGLATNATGPNGTGTINLNTGGRLSTVYISPTGAAGGTRTVGTAGTVNFDGGTLASRAGINSAPTTFFQGMTAANVKAGGAFIDTAAVGVTIGQALLHDPGLGATLDGGLTKRGVNALTLTGVNTYTGRTTVETGTLALGSTGSLGASTTLDIRGGAILDVSAASNWTLGTGQSIVGSGTIVTGAGASFAGTVAPGTSPGTLTVAGAITLTGLYNYEYQGGTANADLLDVNGALTLAGASITFTDLGTFTLLNKFTIASYETLSGTFTGYAADDAVYNLNGQQWVLNYNDTTPGLNGAGDSVTATGFITLTAVPEPGTAFLGSLGLLALFRRRRK